MSSNNKQSNLDILFEHDFDIRNRTIFLTGDIDLDKADKFIKTIAFLDKAAGDITVILNSDGGCVSSGFAIYDIIKSCSNKVTVKAIGSAMSIATIILQAGDVRVATKYCRLMIHRGSAEIEGNFKDVERAMKETQDLDVLCCDIYFEKMKEKNNKFKRAKLESMMDHDTYISSDEALELGLIDEIS